MQQLVTEIAKALVDDPQAVEVQAVAREENTVLRLRVASADVGKVIGKQGRTARSMRTILSAVSMKLHHRYTLDILEEDEPGAPAELVLDHGWSLANHDVIPETWVLLAHIVRPQGRHGEVLADIFTDFPEHFAQRKRLFLRSIGDQPHSRA